MSNPTRNVVGSTTNSATERLRALLHERGVEHYDGTECTYWGDTVLARRDGTCPVYRFSAIEVVDGLSVHLLRVTPEQAVEATLGRGTCEDVGRYAFVCSECGWASDEPHHVLGGFWPKYCPECGRRVVE